MQQLWRRTHAIVCSVEHLRGQTNLLGKSQFAATLHTAIRNVLIEIMAHIGAVIALSAVAHEQRLAIFGRLVAEGLSVLVVGEIARRVGIGAASLPLHMNELGRAGLLSSLRNRRFVRYSVDIEGVRQLLSFLTEERCQCRPEVCGAGVASALCRQKVSGR